MKTPLYAGVRTPIPLGPISTPFTLLIVSTICFSNSAPCSSVSLKPADRIIKARVFFCFARISTVCGQNFAAIASIARSVCGKSLISLYDFIPCISSSLGFEAYKSPLKLPDIIFAKTFPPGLVISFEAPITTILSGFNSCLFIMILFFFHKCIIFLLFVDAII